MKDHRLIRSTKLWKIAASSSLALALGISPLCVSAQQGHQELPGYPVAPGSAAPEEQNSANNVAQAPAPPSASMPEPQQGAAPDKPAANEQLPSGLTLPVGTVIQVRTNEWLSTNRNLPGDGFNATLAQPIIANGWVVAQRGQSVLGRVTMVQKNHRATQIGLQLSELTFADGQMLPIQTQLSQTSGGTDHGHDVGVVGTTTGAGAVIGAIAGGGQGAAVGAGIGAIAGLGVISTVGKPTMIAPETILTFQLQAPVTIATEKGRLAFHPVTQQDYNARPDSRRPQRYGRNRDYEGNRDYE
jgi:hypothetical protein